jgi:hypothetical protein
VRRLLFMGGGMIGALVVAELALRLLHLAPAAGIGTVTSGQFARLPGIYTPNQHVLDLQRPVLPFTVSIDSLGFRGADFARQKPAGQWRVLMLGDSYVYGDFVDDNQTFPFQLEKRLRRACGDALVINAGLGGTTIIDHAFMMQRALALQPDFVVLVFVVDDFDNLGDPVSSWEHLAANRARKSRFPLSVVYPWARNTALWNLVVKARATRMNREDAAQLRERYEGNRAATSQHLRDRYAELLLAMRDTLQSHRVGMALALFPWARELQGASDNSRWLEHYAVEHGFTVVNPLPTFQASHLADTTLYLLPEDGHPSPTGYGIAADVLAEQLLRGPAAPPSCKR